jgi:hypothetical protein
LAAEAVTGSPDEDRNRVTVDNLNIPPIFPPKLAFECAPMTRLPAKVLFADRLGNQYLVTVQVACEKYTVAFDRLSFGKNKPHHGSYRSGWLDLAYDQNPGLKAGQSFPLWAVE